MFNQQHSTETRQKISDHHADISGDKNPMWGRHHSEATREKIRMKRLGKYSGENSPVWRGGRIIKTNGYIWLLRPNHPYNTKGYVREHRLVVEEAMGRYLEKHELVHHIDGNKQNNHVENLKIVTRGLHNTLHFKDHLRGADGKWIVSKL